MKTLATALLISVAVGAILCVVFWELSGDKSTAATFAAAPVATFPKIAEMLEQWQAKKSVAAGQEFKIYSFEGYSIFWPIIAVAGTLIVMATIQLSSGFGGFIIGMLNQELNLKTIGVIGVISIPFQCIGGYLLGRWIGARCARNGAGVVVLVAILGPMGSKLLDYLVFSGESWRTIYEEEKSITGLFGPISILFVRWTSSGLFGFWRGRKHRFAKYLDYLLHGLPTETRNALVDLAFDEAKKAIRADSV